MLMLRSTLKVTCNSNLDLVKEAIKMTGSTSASKTSAPGKTPAVQQASPWMSGSGYFVDPLPTCGGAHQPPFKTGIHGYK